jgi:hypothetical protein
MPIVADETYYDGAATKLARLGLGPLVQEVRDALSSFALLVKEEVDANGAAAVRVLIDQAFEKVGGWAKAVSGDIDFKKCKVVNGTQVCVAVEIQVSGRSDMIAVDLIHLRRHFREGDIDLAILVLPHDKLGPYLTDRTPRHSDAKRHIENAGFTDSPLIVMPFLHDGQGPALPKKVKLPSKAPKE